MYNKKEYMKGYMRRYYEKTRYYKMSRIKLINLLGGICMRCGFSDTRALQLDHKNGGGTQELKKLGPRSVYKYYLDHIIEANRTLQVLCANCNWIKKAEKNENRVFNKNS